MRISSLSAFVLLGAVSATDVKTSCYYDYSQPETQLASRPVEAGINFAGEGQDRFRALTYELMAVQLGQGKIFSEIGQGLRGLTSLDRCWRSGGQHDDRYGNVARLCAALTGPL